WLTIKWKAHLPDDYNFPVVWITHRANSRICIGFGIRVAHCGHEKLSVRRRFDVTDEAKVAGIHGRFAVRCDNPKLRVVYRVFAGAREVTPVGRVSNRPGSLQSCVLQLA